MRRTLPFLAVVCCSLAGLAADPPAVEKKQEPVPEKTNSPPLAVGTDLPGTFHPFNVTGPRKGKFHCLVTTTGLNSGVMIVTRDLEATDSFKELLQRVDNAVEKNPNVKMLAFCVCIPDELPAFNPDMFPDILERKKQGDLVDDKREELSAKIEELARGTMLKHMVMALTHKSDLKAYGLAETAVYTVVIFHNYEVKAVESLEKEKLSPEKVNQIIQLIGDKLGARRK